MDAKLLDLASRIAGREIDPELHGPLGTITVSARALWGSAPFEWWSSVDNAVVNSDPNWAGGQGIIQPPLGGALGQPGPSIAVHFPNLGDEWNLFVLCDFADSNPPLSVQWGTNIAGSVGGQAQQVQTQDPAQHRWAFVIPAATSAMQQIKELSVSGIGGSGTANADLLALTVLPFT